MYIECTVPKAVLVSSRLLKKGLGLGPSRALVLIDIIAYKEAHFSRLEFAPFFPLELHTASSAMAASVALLILTATLTVYTGSKLSAGNSLLPLDTEELEATEMTHSQALIIPISSSICLLVLFFFFAYVQYLLVAMLVLVGSSAAFQLINLGLQHLFVKANRNLLMAVSVCATIVGLVDWILTGNIVIHNTLGCALCTVFISTLRFPSLKVAVLCLTLLAVYDIFWVFCSEYFFTQNVMVEVATKVASNPVHAAGQHFNIDLSKYVNPTMELPLKLMVPTYQNGRSIMLGLGDIALPGALVAFALRCDHEFVKDKVREEIAPDEEAALLSKTGSSPGGSAVKTAAVIPTPLFNTTMAGYFVGLIAAFVGNTLSGLPQPALIYLVPGVLLPLIGKAWAIGKLNYVWVGPTKAHSSL